MLVECGWERGGLDYVRIVLASVKRSLASQSWTLPNLAKCQGIYHKYSHGITVSQDGSDHMLVTGVRLNKGVVSSRPKYINKRSYKNFDSSKFVAAVEQINQLDVYLCTDVNMTVELISEKNSFHIRCYGTYEVYLTTQKL